MRESKDFYIYNDGTTLTASSPAIKAVNSKEMLQGTDGYKKAFTSGKLMIVDMADDDEILARIVLGELSADEIACWSGRTRGIIDCTDGKFSVQSSFNNFKDYSPFDLKRSAGMGVRLFMPAFGLLGIDFGYGFDPIPGTLEPNGWETHFIIGQRF